MNNQLLIIILLGILASCGMPVSSLYQDKMLSVTSAEKIEWVGGRAGVRGIMYTLKLKKKTNNIITVKTLRAEGNTIVFTQNNSGDTITIRGNYPYENKEDNMVVNNIPVEKPMGNTGSGNLNPKDNWIEYIIKGSKIPNRINISKFTSVESSEEPIP